MKARTSRVMYVVGIYVRTELVYLIVTRSRLEIMRIIRDKSSRCVNHYIYVISTVRINFERDKCSCPLKRNYGLAY